MPAITAQRQIWPLAFLDVIYYILNKEIQEFVVKIKMLFLRSLEIFISSKEINLCRLDTFPTMVANRPVMYNRVRVLDFFEFYSVCSCSYTHVSNRHGLPLSIANKQTDAVRHCIFLNKACGVFFRECRTDFLCVFVHFKWHGIALHLWRFGFRYKKRFI